MVCLSLNIILLKSEPGAGVAFPVHAAEDAFGTKCESVRPDDAYLREVDLIRKFFV